jgi:hypothetical protein
MDVVVFETFFWFFISSLRTKSLVDALNLAHSALDVERTNVLPALLQQGDQEVDGQVEVSLQLFRGHLNVTDGNTQAQNLLQLELDGRADVSDLLLDVIIVSDRGRELVHLVQLGTQDTRNLLDDGISGEEGVVLVGPLLDDLLVLVELLQAVHINEVKTSSLGFVAVQSVSDNADLLVRSGNVGQTVGTSKTLILVGIVVLEADLELDSLKEMSLVSLGSFQNGENLLLELFLIQLAHCGVVRVICYTAESKAPSKTARICF